MRGPLAVYEVTYVVGPDHGMPTNKLTLAVNGKGRFWEIESTLKAMHKPEEVAEEEEREEVEITLVDMKFVMSVVRGLYL